MKRYNTPHCHRVIKTRLTEEEYAEFSERVTLCKMSQSEYMHGLEKGVGRALFKLLIRDGLIAVDLNKQINLTEPRREEYNGTEYFCK